MVVVVVGDELASLVMRLCSFVIRAGGWYIDKYTYLPVMTVWSNGYITALIVLNHVTMRVRFLRLPLIFQPII